MFSLVALGHTFCSKSLQPWILQSVHDFMQDHITLYRTVRSQYISHSSIKNMEWNNQHHNQLLLDMGVN